MRLITCQYSTYVSMDIILQYTPFFALKLYPREHSEHCFHKIRLIVANEIAYLKKTFYWHSMYMTQTVVTHTRLTNNNGACVYEALKCLGVP